MPDPILLLEDRKATTRNARPQFLGEALHLLTAVVKGPGMCVCTLRKRGEDYRMSAGMGGGGWRPAVVIVDHASGPAWPFPRCTGRRGSAGSRCSAASSEWEQGWKSTKACSALSPWSQSPGAASVTSALISSCRGLTSSARLKQQY